MGKIVKMHPRWPVFEKHIRSLCRFFRTVSYRRAVVRNCRSKLPEVALLVGKFHEDLAHWRFQTVSQWDWSVIDFVRSSVTLCAPVRSIDLAAAVGTSPPRSADLCVILTVCVFGWSGPCAEQIKHCSIVESPWGQQPRPLLRQISFRWVLVVGRHCVRTANTHFPNNVWFL